MSVTTSAGGSARGSTRGGGSAGGFAKGDKFNARSAGSKSFNFAPGFNPTLNVNASRTSSGGGFNGGGWGNGGGGAHPQSLLPAPEFNSPAQVREYCNALRAAMTGISFEISMAAEILKSVLAQVPDPDGRIGGSRLRAARVGRKLNKSADAARDAAKNAAATYQAFVQAYEQEMARVRHRATRPGRHSINWAQQ